MPDPFLSTAELISMRHTVDTYLAGTAVIHTKTAASDGQGGENWTYAASGTVDARLSPLSGSEVELASKLSERNAYMLTIPSETSLSVTARVIYDSVTYEVINVADRTPWEISRRVMVVERG